MRLSLRGDAESARDDSFRAVTLAMEIQNEAEVKPVLDELEVVRLNSALGLLSTVTPKDVEDGLVPAEAFDEELAHDLRHALCQEDGAVNADRIVPLGLFGKQQEVKRALVRCRLLSANLVTQLKSQAQGIYCIKRSQDSATLRTEDAPTIVLFAWIQDVLLDPSGLRDTATYVLRFLACMGSDLQCCLSPHDVAAVKEAARSLLTARASWSPSFSVGFRVEEQEDKKDGMCCDHIGTVDLPSLDDARNVRLLKGNYPAVSAVRSSPQLKRVNSTRETFYTDEQIIKLIADQAQHYALKFSFRDVCGAALLVMLLEQGGYYPEDEPGAMTPELVRGLECIQKQICEEVGMATEKRRAELFAILDHIFSIDTLLGTPGHTGTEHESLKDILKMMEGHAQVWSAIDSKTQVLLRLPRRLKSQIKGIFAAFHEQYHGRDGPGQLGQILAAIPFERKKVIRSETRNSFFSKMWRYVVGSNSSAAADGDEVEIANAFRERLKDPLAKMKSQWWEDVGVMLKK